MTDFDTLAHPRGAAGKFTDRTHSAPERGLSHPVCHLLDNYGDEFLLTPGIIDDNARHVFTEGQALALAAVVSRATGWPLVIRTSGDGRGTSGPPALIHAWVEDPDGDLIDINGLNDREESDDKFDGSIDRQSTFTIDEFDNLFARYRGFIPAQEQETAAEFVDAVLNLWSRDRANKVV